MNYFITGIDTDIGKTFITKGLALILSKRGKKVGVFKPLQSGAIKINNTLLAPDIEEVKKISHNINTKCSYLFEGEVSPALAAKLNNIQIDINKINKDFLSFSKENEITLVEGAGGILSPATENLLCADIIKYLNLQIIIVTVPFLGRLNHTLLTIECAKNRGIPIKGLIINKVPNNTKNIATNYFIEELKKYTDVKILGIIKETKNIENEFKNIDI